MNIFWQDLQYTFRLLYKNRVYTIVALIVLTLGIGVNSAIFSFVNAILLRSLPYSEASRLVRVYSTSPGKEIRTFTTSYPDFLDWQKENKVFEKMAAWVRGSGTLTGTDNPERFDMTLVTADFFSVLGVNPALGRTFTPEEDKPGNNNVVILTHGVWERRFGADPGVIGAPFMLDGASYKIIGVLPADFQFLFPVDLLTPLSRSSSQWREDRGRRFVSVLARLNRGASLQQANLDLQKIAARIEKDFPKTNEGWSNNAALVYDELTGGIRGALWMLFAATALVLMISCSNIANLQLIRAASRSKEIAIRMAIGANRGRLIRQLITESLVLAVMGGALGLLLASWGVNLLKSVMPASRIPRLNEVGLDGSVILFTVIISLVTGVIFGLSPAFRASRLNLQESLKDGRQASTGMDRNNRLRSALVICEVALAFMLTVFAGLVIQTFKRLIEIDPGFQAENVLTMQMTLHPSRYTGPPQIGAFYNKLLEDIEARPGVVSAAATDNLPLVGGGGYVKIYVDGQQDTKSQEAMSRVQLITPDYFRTMGVPFRSGRDFTTQDYDYALIVNETTAKKFWPNEEPLGKRIRFRPDGAWSTVVGVVTDIKTLGLTTDPRVEVFLPLGENIFRTGSVVVRTSISTENILPSLRATVANLDKDMAVYNVRKLETLVSDSIAQPRFNTILFGIFAALALVLSSVGIYGVMSNSVSQRTHELGVRMAMGARSRDIISLVLKQGIILALIGVGIGIAGAIALSKALATLLYGISATDPLTFVLVAVILIAAALMACFFPARKAAKVDPLITMKYE